MSKQRAGLGSRTLALVVIAVFIVGALGLASISYIPQFQHTSSNETTRTCTEVFGTDGSYSFYCPEPLRMSGTTELWNFTVTINTDSVAPGEHILLLSSLVNTAGQNQTVKDWVEPSVNPVVYSLNGTQVWQWNPPQHTLANMTFSSGQKVSESVSIPTLGLEPGHSYLIKVEPLSIQFHLNDGETPYTFQFTVK